MSEYTTHQIIKNNLIKIGWEDGNKDIREHTLIEDYILKDILIRHVKNINRNIFTDLTQEEKEELINNIIKELNSNEEKILDYLKYGITINTKSGKITIKLIDYNNINNNSFLFLHEAKFEGSPDNIKPDFTLFINGIPIIIIEAKSEMTPFSHNEAIEDIKAYEKYSPDLFRFVQFAIAYGDKKYYLPTQPNWDKREIDKIAYKWHNNIFDLLRPKIILEFIKYFIFFRNYKDKKTKIIARYNQYKATIKVMDRIKKYLENRDEKNKGLIWHWQGSGKTLTMYFIANYFLDLYYDKHPVIFFLVDRQELERQHDTLIKSVINNKFKSLYENIKSIKKLCDVIGNIKRSEFLKGVIPTGIYLTTIQKFQWGKKGENKIYDLLLDLSKEYLNFLEKNNSNSYVKSLDINNEKELLNLGTIQHKYVLFLIDEAHRSQYGNLAAVRKKCFKNSIDFAFTGTPIFKNEKDTFKEFSYPEKGEFYLDVYFIKDSIRDGYTVPIVYEAIKEKGKNSGGIKITLSEEDIKGFIEEYKKYKGDPYKVFEKDLNNKIYKYINNVRVFLENEKRIEKLAKYIVDRIEKDTENFKYKAMVVAVNRRACVIYKEKLDYYLAKKFGEKAKNWVKIVMTYYNKERDGKILEFMEKLKKEEKSKSYNEINKEIQEAFKEKDEPRILVVTDMLLTGFDAPMLKVMYLDKLLYGHRLLQAIARTNRPYKDKEFGLVVDCTGKLLKYLSETMKLYNDLAEENSKSIKEDFQKHLVKDIKEEFSEFLETLSRLKENLKKLKIDDESVSIDLDKVKNLLNKKGEEIKIKKELDEKIKIIGLYSNRVEIIEIVDKMEKILKIYKALGSYPEKILYVKEVEIIAYLYYKLISLLKRKEITKNKEFWEELISLIHENTVIGDFRTVIKIDLDPSKLKKLTKMSHEKEKNSYIAEYYFYIKNLISEDNRNPLYKEIAERLENLRKKWINKEIELEKILKELRKLERKIKDYKNDIEHKDEFDKLKITIEKFVKEKIGKTIKFNEVINYLKKLPKGVKILPKQEEDIKRIITGLFLKEEVKISDRKKLEDEIIELIKEWVDNSWKERK